MTNILFTSVGRRFELVEAFQNSYRKLGLKGLVVGVDINPLAPALTQVDRRYIVPPINDPEYLPQLVEICRTEGVALLFPLVDPEIPLLASNKPMFAQVGTTVMTPPPDAVEICSDKWKTYKFFMQLDIPVPPSVLPEMGIHTLGGFPLFIRPRFGSASKDAFLVRNARELECFIERIADPIIQEFLPGPEITSDVVSGTEGEVLGVVCRQRIEVRGGEVMKAVTVHDERIVDACVRIAESLNSVGPLTIQCMLKNGIPYFTEINTRFGGGAPLGFAAGMDSPLWLLARAAGIPVEIPPRGSYEGGLHMTRCDRSLFLRKDSRGRHQSHSLRPG